MNSKFHITDENILDYIDGALSQDERIRMEEAASENPEIANRISELKQLDTWLAVTEGRLEEPSRDFNQIIMVNLDRPFLVDSLVKIRKSGLFILLMSLLTIAIGSYFMTDSIVTLNTIDKVKLLSFSDTHLPEAFNLKILSQTLLFGGLITSLLLLDRVILKPLFRQRQTNIEN